MMDRGSAKDLTGPTTFTRKPTGKWEIYSVQRQLPVVNDGAHNYLACNSVWGTALRSIGVQHPQDFNGQLEAPGWATDLRTAPTNNDDIGTPDDSSWQPNPAIGVIHQSNASSPAGVLGEGTAVSSVPQSSSSAADAVADAGRPPIAAQAKNWRRRPDDLSSVDLVRALIWTRRATHAGEEELSWWASDRLMRH
jgi:hypothetical protein